MMLIADSGSTKADWSVVSTSGSIKTTFTTEGINPYHKSRDLIKAILGEVSARVEACQTYDTGKLHVYFYGSGIRPEQQAPMKSLLHNALPSAETIEAQSDMLGAARSLCGRNYGIACVLGTGANACLYDGENVIQNTPALGYILGDEGSGAVLGKSFIHDLYSGLLSEELKVDFETETGFSLAHIIERVYRQPQANRFLASFSPFIHEHLDSPGLRALVVDNFSKFLTTHVAPYDRRDLPVSFVGSIAWAFQRELRQAAASLGFTIGTVFQSPMQGIISYHSNR